MAATINQSQQGEQSKMTELRVARSIKMGRKSSRRLPSLGNRSAILCVLAFLSVCVLTDGNSASAAGIESYRLATGFYQRKKWELSVKEFRSFLKDQASHPKAEKAQVYLGMALVNLQQYKDARGIFQAFLKKYPKSRYLSHAMFRAGECSFLLNDLKAAEGELADFLKRFPTDPLANRARYNLAETKISLEKPAESTELYQQVIEADADSGLTTQAKFGLAKAYTQLKKLPEAEKVYAELAKALPGEAGADALIQLADLHFDQRDFALAATEYAEVVTRNPNSPLVSEARLKTGMSLFGAGKYPEAIKQFDPLIADEKHGLEAEFWKGVSLKSTGDYATAATVLKTNYDRLGNSPQAPRTLYQWGDSEQLAGRYPEAKARFLELVAKWPQHALADDSLHAAGLSALKAKNLEEAEQLTARFSQEYPTSGLRIRQQLLRGRLNLTRGRTAEKAQAANFYRLAGEQFQSVLQSSKIPATKSRAQYFLAFSEYELGNYSEALAVIMPVVEEAAKATKDAESIYVDAHVLQALCHLKLEKYKAAGLAATAYLGAAPQGEFVSQALGIRARAAALLGEKASAEADQESLKADWPETLDYLRTTEEIAEIAYTNGDYPWSATLYAQLAKLDKQSKFRPVGLWGWGWALYRQKKYEPAAEAFAQVVAEYPEHRLAAESGFKHGTCLRDLGKTEAAADRFLHVFKTYAPSEKAFIAGLAAARQLRALKRIDEADKTYDSLVKQYPQRDDLAQLLNEWAVMHHAAENYQQSDALFRQLVEKHSDHELADEARLNLAISSLFEDKFTEAREQFRALESKPDVKAAIREEALYRLINIDAKENHWKQAKSLSEESLKKFPQGKHAWDARFRSAQADYYLHQFAEAKLALLKLKAARGEPAMVVEGQPAGEETVGDYDWYPEIWIMLAEIDFRNKEYAGVAKVIADFTAASPDSPYLYQVEEILGRSLKAQGDFAEARKVFERITTSKDGKLTETAAKSQFLIADMYFLEKNYEKAVEEFFKVDILYDFPAWQSPALLGVGKCEEQNGNWKKAVQAYEDLLKRFPQSARAEEAKKRLAFARQKASS